MRGFALVPLPAIQSATAGQSRRARTDLSADGHARQTDPAWGTYRRTGRARCRSGRCRPAPTLRTITKMRPPKATRSTLGQQRREGDAGLPLLGLDLLEDRGFGTDSMRLPGDGEGPLHSGLHALAGRRVRDVWLGSYPAYRCAERSVIMGRRDGRGRQGRRDVRWRLVTPNGEDGRRARPALRLALRRQARGRRQGATEGFSA
jgi:hypothetical protein